ncbi:hypothetical protein KPH14_005227 [Odynerus spinipes]|uniref:PBAN-type neuropeptides n=1 Tax=Odynerus spinipes TaxID=1348599 RepID=A0AAD9RB83_9HYME|nr:hypothetical protein KPH14_005227 [Odynerus spinipes]
MEYVKRVRGEIVTTPSDTLASPIKPQDRWAISIKPCRECPEEAGTRNRERRGSSKNGTMLEFVARLSRTSRTSCCSCALIFLLFLLSCTTAEYDTRDAASASNDRTQDNDLRSCTEGKCIKRTTQEISSGMWFGPRLGKRHKFDSRTDVDNELETIANALDGSRWAIVTIPDDKRRTNRVKFYQERDYDEDLSNFSVSKDSEDNREDKEAQPFSFAIGRGGRHVPWPISSRFTHRSRVPVF